MKSICFKAPIIFLFISFLFYLSISSTLASEIDYFNEGFYHYNLAESAMQNKNYMMAFQEYGKAAELFDKGGYTEMKNLSIEKSIEASKLNNQSSSPQQTNSNSEQPQIDTGRVIIIIGIFIILFYFLSKISPDKKSSRENGYKSIKGDYHRSNAERMIANWFYRNNIRYDYERVKIPKTNSKYGYYIPDFRLLDHSVYVEYFGVVGDDKYYNKTSDKQKCYEERKMKVMYLHPDDLPHIEKAFRREFEIVMRRGYNHYIKYKSVYDVPENK